MKGEELRKKYSFSNEDVLQIKALGLRPTDVKKQLETYQRGPSFLKLLRACITGDGIRSVSAIERNRLIKLYDVEAAKYSMLKFVPASGAASRMFARWFSAADHGSFGDKKADLSFYRDLKKMPFAPLIEQNKTACRHLKQKNIPGLLNHILLSGGLNYGWLPKALIPFHAYSVGEIRTALEEHLVEAASYIQDQKGNCRLHLTFSEEHIKKVKSKIREVKSRYERKFRVRFKIEQSIQSQSTNIIAVNEHLSPFRNNVGSLVFRPGGHGALLQNLASLDADFIFVKNIDNIAPETLQKKILPYKKMLGGLALQLQKSVFAILQELNKSNVTTDRIESYVKFCRWKLNIVFGPAFDHLSFVQKKKKIFALLNRPLRVCGMVRNEGEPGGAPFWVEEKDGAQTLQIVESAHVNLKDPKQSAVWRQAQYFNPVDMVCCIRDNRGRKFRLQDYVNPDAYLISSKTEKGKILMAQELPGLWNGGMAYWNTVFVELPLIVFNPVKTVYDLLRPQHRNSTKIK